MKEKRERATDEQIEERRQKIVSFFGEYGETLSTKQLAKIMGVSVATIERDMKALRTDSFNWVSELAKQGYVYECRMTYSKLAGLSAKLLKRLKSEEATLPIDDICKLAAQIAKLEESKMSIIQSPTLYNLKATVRKTTKAEEMLGEG